MIQIRDKDFEAPIEVRPLKPPHQVSTKCPVSNMSKRWASDQRLGFEVLRRQEELTAWIEAVLETQLSSDDLHESLRSGHVLCQLVRFSTFQSSERC